MADGLIKGIINEGDRPLERFTQQVAAILNSLLRGGVIVRTAGGGWTTTTEDGLAIEFEWNNATTRFVGQVPGGRTVSRVRVLLLEAFSDPASTLSVGTLADPDLYFTPDLVDLTAAGEYDATVGIAGGTVYLTLAPAVGESSGAGILVVEYEP